MIVAAALESGCTRLYVEDLQHGQQVGEAAYNFQYLDLATRKYAADSQWLQANRDFTIDHAARIAKAVEEVHADHFENICKQILKRHPDEWTMLPLFAFTANEIAVKANFATDIVERVLSAFELPPTERNEGFSTLHDFNVITANRVIIVQTKSKRLTLESRKGNDQVIQ